MLDKIISEYAKSQKKAYNSFIHKLNGTEISRAYDPERGLKNNTRTTQHYVEVRSDGNRHYRLFKRWGDRVGGPPITEEHAHNAHALWDDVCGCRLGIQSCSRMCLMHASLGQIEVLRNGAVSDFPCS